MVSDDQLKMHSANLVECNIEKIAQIFPHCVVESAKLDGNGYVIKNHLGQTLVEKVIDFDLLRQELSTHLVSGTQERYRLDWSGKKEAILQANAPIAKTLRPYPQESVAFHQTQHLFIEGDNLEALKLLQENYLAKIKMIYIDPPYNTGNDFIYNDDFSEDSTEFLKKSQQIDAVGQRLVSNKDTDGRYHSNWLSMMYSRLKLARNLLSDNGVIFISIDENEIANLKKICEEIFGESNFLFQITLLCNPKGRSQDKYIANCHEYILGFSKNNLEAGSLNIAKTAEEIQANYKLSDDQGRYREMELRNTHREFGKHNRPKLYYPFYVQPDGSVSLENQEASVAVYPHWEDGFEGCWTWGQPKAIAQLDELLAKNIKGQWKIYRKSYAFNDEGTSTKQVKSIWQDPSFYTEKGQTAFNLLFETKDKIFQSPKSVALIKQLLAMAIQPDDIVLDFFGGSGTIAQAVYEYNAENNLNTQFIAVQLAEKTQEKSEAFKAGYHSIADVAKERIRRAGAQVLKNTPNLAKMDIGFRVLKIDSSNLKDIYYTPEQIDQADLFALADHIKADRTDEDLLFQVMLDWGLALSLPIEVKEIQDKKVFYVAGNSLVACFASVDAKLLDKIAEDKPIRFVLTEKAIAYDHDKPNIKQRFKQYSPRTQIKFI